MALVDGTLTTYGTTGRREDLTDVIYDISPMDTPLLSGSARTSAKQTLHEWQTDELRAAAANAHLEGDDATFVTPSTTVRVGNYLQISREEVIVSETDEVVDKAGRKSELARLIAKKGKELKRDMEFIMLQATAGNAGAAGTARQLASLSSWLQTNVSFGVGGAASGHSAGVPSAAVTDGTQRAFTETILKSVISDGYTAGADFNVLMVGPFNKTAVSAFTGVVTRNFDISNQDPRPTAIIAAADVYVHDFGVLRVIPNRFQRERDAYLIDFDMLAVPFLRPFKQVKLAKTGDAEKRMLIVEYTLQVKNEAGLGFVGDLTAS